jgi:GTP pyrophosphokinase
MHEEAELGVAAHWAYKSHTRSDGKQYRWLRELLEIVEQAQKPEEFLEHTKLELFQDQVFCFTPKGDLIALPQGATPVDFAYAVHSEVGDHCVGAKVNGRIVPLNGKLLNGDQVEIIRSKSQKPSPAWERFAVTGKARARIRRYIRNQQRDEYVTLGKAMLQKAFRQEGRDLGERSLNGVLKGFRAETTDDLLAEIGAGNRTTQEVLAAVYPGQAPGSTGGAETKVLPFPSRPRPKGKEGPLPIRGLVPGLAVHYARCCHPLPGDQIVGIVTTGKGVTVHTVDCETLESFSEAPERWLDIAWDEAADGGDHIGRLFATISNETGSLGTLTTVIGRNGGNITNLRVISRSMDFWDLLIDIKVADVKHLTNMIAALRATPAINQVDRARN